MPTGYTSILSESDVSFNEFTWRCARAFGAFITDRDDPLDSPVRVRVQQSDYHSNGLITAQEDLAKAQNFTLKEAARMAAEEYSRAYKTWEEMENKRLTLKSRYEAMIAKVEAWDPPTTEHEGLKQFMLEQLRSSLEWDCGLSDPPKRLSAAEFKTKAILNATWSIEYHSRFLSQEAERCEKATKWITALRESIGDPPKMRI